MLGFILGPMLEENFRRAMILSRGSFSIFVTHPISATVLALIALLVAGQVLFGWRAKRALRANGREADPIPER
jgi:TctA family transporter